MNFSLIVITSPSAMSGLSSGMARMAGLTGISMLIQKKLESKSTCQVMHFVQRFCLFFHAERCSYSGRIVRHGVSGYCSWGCVFGSSFLLSLCSTDSRIETCTACPYMTRCNRVISKRDEFGRLGSRPVVPCLPIKCNVPPNQFLSHVPTRSSLRPKR